MKDTDKTQLPPNEAVDQTETEQTEAETMTPDETRERGAELDEIFLERLRNEDSDDEMLIVEETDLLDDEYDGDEDTQ